jgi:hypothetical protein
LDVANGGTGASTSDGALTNLLPSQIDNSGKVLTTNGTVTSWILPFSGSYNDLTDKPVLFNGSFTSLTDVPTTLAGYGITDTVVTSVNGIVPTPGGGGVSLSSSDLTDGTSLVKTVNNISPDETGAVSLTLLSLGIIEGTENQVLATDGNGLYSFVTPTVSASNITGVISISNGGTGSSSIAAGYVTSDGTVLSSSLTIAGADVTGDIIGNAGNVTGVVAIENGGTGANNAADAINALVPNQTDNNGKLLTTNGSVVSWADYPSLTTLTDVNATNLAASDLLNWDAVTSKWINVPASSVTVGFSTTATNIAGGDANQIVYNSATGTTAFIPVPTTVDSVLYWDGTAYVWGTVGDASAITTTGGITTDADFYVAMTAANDGSAQSLNTTTNLKFNPSKNQLSVPIIKMLNAQTASISFTSSDTTTDQVVDQLSITEVRTVKYTIQATSGTDYQTTEILMIHDGVDVYLTEYGSMVTNVSVCSFNADILGGQMRLLMTPVNSSTLIKAIRNTIDV